MNKKELMNAIYNQIEGAKKGDIAVIVDVCFEEIAKAMADGKEVSIPKFGKFVAADVAERTARNPQNGEEVVVPAHRKPKFKPATALKDQVK